MVALRVLEHSVSRVCNISRRNGEWLGQYQRYAICADANPLSTIGRSTLTAANNRQASLGVVAIARNEEQNMPRFLEHLLPWVDEIVIVDDGSTDGTADICRSAGSKVTFIEHPTGGEKDFALQRNVGIEASTSDWLLHTDIDMRITSDLADEICQGVRSTQYDAYRYRRLNFFLHRPVRAGGWERWNQPWLARRDILRFEGRLHEHAHLTITSERIGQLRSPMWHLNDRSYTGRLQKSLLYSQLDAERILSHNTRIKWYHLIVRPLKHFAIQYVLRRGIIDGVPGLILAIHSADAVFRSNAIVWDRQNYINRDQLEVQIKRDWEKRLNNIAGQIHQRWE